MSPGPRPRKPKRRIAAAGSSPGGGWRPFQVAERGCQCHVLKALSFKVASPKGGFSRAGVTSGLGHYHAREVRNYAGEPNYLLKLFTSIDSEYARKPADASVPVGGAATSRPCSVCRSVSRRGGSFQAAHSSRQSLKCVSRCLPRELRSGCSGKNTGEEISGEPLGDPAFKTERAAEFLKDKQLVHFGCGKRSSSRRRGRLCLFHTAAAHARRGRGADTARRVVPLLTKRNAPRDGRPV